ncbi:conjugal transfer protein TrbH [Herbaspirillum camelliae]|uniref:conjugal transfer protein TrbH n=1 Tax=Herbaspirillum camelliae TaxID=1892903 RepID=UPI000949F069|nr:conjugal transfer protein TrbH [Herbaspirillum camelliae]
MNRIFLMLLLSLATLTSACTTRQYGNFLAPAPFDQGKLAEDVVRQLIVLYAPAHTRIDMQQATPDPFGQALVKALRADGYAVSEYAPPDTATARKPSSTDALPLRYVLDRAGDMGGNLYHVSLQIGNQTVARPYLVQDGVISPAGYWVRKE